MFRALLAHLQEALHKQQLVHCVDLLSRIKVGVARFHAMHQLFFKQRLLKMSK
jgi:hypothetical protein